MPVIQTRIILFIIIFVLFKSLHGLKAIKLYHCKTSKDGVLRRRRWMLGRRHPVLRRITATSPSSFFPPGVPSHPLRNHSPCCSSPPPLRPSPSGLLRRCHLYRNPYSSLLLSISISFSHDVSLVLRLCVSRLAAGPKQWLKEQKRKAAKFILAPIEASRQSLHDAFDMLGDHLLSILSILYWH